MAARSGIRMAVLNERETLTAMVKEKRDEQ